jgi:hypothetical protein
MVRFANATKGFPMENVLRNVVGLAVSLAASGLAFAITLA